MRGRLLALLMMVVLTATGCGRLPAEERSFAVALGISASAGVWEVTARIPSYQQEGGYVTLAARGASLGEAMALLNAAAPMRLHYGQLRMIVFSRELAESPDFPGVLHALAARPDVRLQASLCVTEDNMTDLMDSLEPQTGTRLSKSIETLLETRLNLGVVPDATLSNLRRMGERQGAVLISVALEKEPANTVPGMDAPAGVQAAKGAGETQFAGGWMIGKDGMVRGQLTALDQQLLALMEGNLRKGMLALPEGAVMLLDASSRIKFQEGQGVCEVRIRYSAADLLKDEMERSLSDALSGVTDKLAAAGCDALGIGRRVIASCATIKEWHDLRWKERYPALQWKITVEAVPAV